MSIDLSNAPRDERGVLVAPPPNGRYATQAQAADVMPAPVHASPGSAFGQGRMLSPEQRQPVAPGATQSRQALATIATLAFVITVAIVVVLQWLPPPHQIQPGERVPDTLSATTPAASEQPTVQSTPLPTARPALASGLAVYFAPAGDLAPSLQATTAYTPTARFHEDWVQLTVAGYAQAVWARSDSVPEVALESLPDLAPPPTATPAPIVIVREIHVPVPVACTRGNAVAIKSQDVTNAKGVPIGHAEAWSCTSEADAAAQLQAQIAEIEQRANP